MAAGFTAVNLVFAWLRLPESHRAMPVAQLGDGSLPWRPLAAPLAVLFASTLAFSVMYVVFPLFGETRFGASRATVGYWFAFVGLVTAIVQGGLIGRLAAALGEVRVARLGTALLGSGFLLVTVSGGASAAGVPFYLALILLGAGYGMTGPSMIGLISRTTSPARQGRVLGITQSASSMARIVGPIVAGS